MQKRTCAAMLAVLLIAGTTSAFAAGSKTSPSPEPQEQTLTPEQEAVEHYNSGISLRERAWKLTEKLETATEDKQRAKLESKIAKSYKRASQEFRTATQKNSRMYSAYSELGYCLRKLGDYRASLEAYDTALSIEPRYAEAVEYRAEAYLGLNRLDEAKEAYMQLFGGARPLADKLLEAMQSWVAETRANGGDGVDPNRLEEFAGWVAERSELAAQTESISQLQKHDW